MFRAADTSTFSDASRSRRRASPAHSPPAPAGWGRLLAGLLAVALLGLPALPARAADVRASTSTVVIGSEVPRAGDEVSSYPLFELLALEVSQLGLPGFDRSRLVARGWGRLQLGDDTVVDDAGDLGLLYLETQSQLLTLRLGRQYVVPGAARMTVLDGLDARVDPGAGFSLQAFGGFVTPQRFDWQSGDWEAGGRLGWHAPGSPDDVGVSYRHERHAGDLAREELALDGYSLVGPARITLMAALSPREARFSEARLTAGFTVAPGVQITADAERVTPDLFLPRDSIFWVFTDVSHDSLGGDASWAPSPYYTFRLEGYALLLDGDLLGSQMALQGTLFREPNHRSFVGGEVRRVDETENAYLRGRLFTGLQVLDDFRVSADGYAYTFDEKIHGARNSYLGQVSLAWDPFPSGRLAAAVTAGSSPLATFQLEGLLRFTYGYGVDLAQEVGP